MTLTIWHSEADSPAITALYQRYEKESGNKLSFVNIPAATFGMVIQTKWATGARPDILEWQGNDADTLSMNMAQNAIALTSLPFVKQEGALAKMSGYANGQVYAATLGPNLIYGIYYNKAVFAKAGLAAPKTYADLASDCTVLKAKDPGVTPIFEAAGSSFPPQALASFLYTSQYNIGGSYASQVVKGTAKLNDPNGPFLAGLKAYQALKSAGCFNSDAATATWAQQTQAVLNGQAAMMAEDSNSINQLVSQANGDASAAASKVGFVPVSATEPIANTSPDPIGTYYIPKTGDTTKEQAAIGFIKFITSNSQYQAYVNQAQSIPTLSGIKTPNLTGLWAEAAGMVNGAGLTLNSAIPGFGNQFGTQSDELIAGQETPQQVADKMQAYVEQALAAVGG
ncbi:MAG TPA: extracellular solute-binding protein [Trebonia sp.]|nr:extracellular solute-binding protein [Trebonia sp.]